MGSSVGSRLDRLLFLRKELTLSLDMMAWAFSVLAALSLYFVFVTSPVIFPILFLVAMGWAFLYRWFSRRAFSTLSEAVSILVSKK